jgi:hypothetical protein
MRVRALLLVAGLGLGCDLFDEVLREVERADRVERNRRRPPTRAQPPRLPGPSTPTPSPSRRAPQSDTSIGQAARDLLARCVPDTLPERQNRAVMKHRPVPYSLASAFGTTVEEMFTWPPAEGLGERGARDSDRAIDPREEALYVLDVEIHVAKLSDDDCDIHLEVSAPGGGPDAPRVILELAQGEAYDGMRYGLADALGRRSRGFGRSPVSPPLRARVGGYAFYDAHHACSRDRQRGCTHGSARVASVWELHPVVALALEE